MPPERVKVMVAFYLPIDTVDRAADIITSLLEGVTFKDDDDPVPAFRIASVNREYIIDRENPAEVTALSDRIKSNLRGEREGNMNDSVTMEFGNGQDTSKRGRKSK